MQFLIKGVGTYEVPVGTSGWVLGTVVLPIVNNVIDDLPTEGEDFEIDGGDPIIISTARSARTLTVLGVIAEASHSKADLDLDYLQPLRAMRGTVQTFIDPRLIYAGEWLVRSLSFSEVAQGSNLARFTFRMVLKQGSGDFVDQTVSMLSLIHISEPTRRTPISYAV